MHGNEPFGFCNLGRISWLADELLLSQEGLCSKGFRIPAHLLHLDLINNVTNISILPLLHLLQIIALPYYNLSSFYVVLLGLVSQKF